MSDVVDLGRGTVSPDHENVYVTDKYVFTTYFMITKMTALPSQATTRIASASADLAKASMGQRRFTAVEYAQFSGSQPLQTIAVKAHGLRARDAAQPRVRRRRPLPKRVTSRESGTVDSVSLLSSASPLTTRSQTPWSPPLPSMDSLVKESSLESL